MKDRLLIIREMNKAPLQQHAKKLLEQEKQETSESMLYLMQVALQVRENPQMSLYMREVLNHKTCNQLMTDVENLIIASPQRQMLWLVNSEEEALGCNEDLMEQNTLTDLVTTIADNVILYRETIEALERADLDRQDL